jgi:ABC-type antimicrobial peptide transport system permease subunit
MKNVLGNPLRFLVIVCLLGASLMFVAALASLNESVQQQLANAHQQIGTGITITYAVNDSHGTGQAGTLLPNSAVTTAQRVPGVSSVEGHLTRAITDGTLKGIPLEAPNGKSVAPPPTANGIAAGTAHFTLAGGATPILASGRSFQASDANASVAMMSQALARANHLTVGSTFPLKGQTFTLIGLYTTGQTFADDSLIVPLATMQRVFGANGVDSMTAYAQSYEQIDAVAAGLRASLGKAYDVVPDATDYTTTLNALTSVQNSIRLALLIAVLTAALVIILTVMLMVREQTQEIGTLKAIGASHWQVIRQFWGEVLALSLAAALLAVILLATLGPAISQAFTVPTTTNTTPGGFAFSSPATNLTVHLSPATLNAGTLLMIVGLGAGLALLTSVIPAWYVARIKPAEVLRRG